MAVRGIRNGEANRSGTITPGFTVEAEIRGLGRTGLVNGGGGGDDRSGACSLLVWVYTLRVGAWI